MKWKSLLMAKPITALLILLTVTTVVTATTLFTQTFPVVTTAAMTQSCAGGNLVLAAPSEPLPSGVAGQATFQCPDPNPAFETAGVVTATPTFTLPSIYTNLYIYKWNGAITTGVCSGRSFANELVDNTQEVSLPALSSPSGWNYCAEYGADNIAGLPSFTVTWDSP